MVEQESVDHVPARSVIIPTWPASHPPLHPNRPAVSARSSSSTAPRRCSSARPSTASATRLIKEHGEVQTFVFDGKTAALADVLDELRSFSLMQQYKIVIVDDADVFVTAHREPLERYAVNPVDAATLVLRSGKWNKGNLDKLIERVGSMVKCEPLSENEIGPWLAARAQSVHDRKIDPRAANLLAQRLGGDLALMDNELAKLSVMGAPGEAITVELVEQLVGRGSEEDAWAVQEAILESLAQPGLHTGGRAIEKMRDLVDLAGQPDVLVAYFVADLFRRLYLGALMRRDGASDFQIAGEFKLWGPRKDVFMQVLRRLNVKAAGELFDRIVEMDVRSKTGRGEAVRNLECFCALMGDDLT